MKLKKSLAVVLTFIALFSVCTGATVEASINTISPQNNSKKQESARTSLEEKINTFGRERDRLFQECYEFEAIVAWYFRKLPSYLEKKSQFLKKDEMIKQKLEDLLKEGLLLVNAHRVATYKKRQLDTEISQLDTKVSLLVEKELGTVEFTFNFNEAQNSYQRFHIAQSPTITNRPNADSQINPQRISIIQMPSTSNQSMHQRESWFSFLPSYPYANGTNFDQALPPAAPAPSPGCTLL